MTERRIHAEPRRHWTKTEDRELRRLYPDQRTDRVAKAINRSLSATYGRAAQLGLRKSAAFLASQESGRLSKFSSGGEPYRFKPGQPSWNKGLHYQPGGRAKLTQFKKGNRSLRWPAEDYPVGALRINSDGQLDIKIKEGSRAWYCMARWVWMQERGTIPPAHVIRFRNGDIHDPRIENLELISRAEHLRRNWHDRYPLPIKQMVQLRGALQRQINKREGRHERQHD